MYVVEKKDGTLSMNVVIETKDVYQETDLRPKESAKIDCAKLFFEQLSKDNPSLPIRFERQINRQRLPPSSMMPESFDDIGFISH